MGQERACCSRYWAYSERSPQRRLESISLFPFPCLFSLSVEFYWRFPVIYPLRGGFYSFVLTFPHWTDVWVRVWIRDASSPQQYFCKTHIIRAQISKSNILRLLMQLKKLMQLQIIFFPIKFENFSITWLAHQWILCSEWVPSEWKSNKNITIIHK